MRPNIKPSKRPLIVSKRNGKRGAPSFQVTDEQRDFVTHAVMQGIPHETICTLMVDAKLCDHITHDTLVKHFAFEIEHGSTKFLLGTRRSLAWLIRAKVPSAIYFYLKTKGGFRENSSVELSGPDGKPIVVTDAMSNEERATKLLQVLAIAAAQSNGNKNKSGDE